MRLGRIVSTAEGDARPLLVAVEPEAGRVIDLATAMTVSMVRHGATRSAARRIAGAWFNDSMTAAISAGDALFDVVTTAVDHGGDDASIAMDGVQWLSPIDPQVYRDCLVFEQHLVTQYGRIDAPVPKQFYRAPAYYKGNPTTLIGHDAAVVWPYDSGFMDYELEFGIVLGRSALDVTPDEAKDSIFGFTVLNDFSARDVQGREMSARLGPAKGKDFATAVGPWITTADEVDVTNMTMVARVNGEEWSRGSSGSTIWSVEEIVAYISQSEPTVPGELIGSGTVGTGSGSDLGRRLDPGDTVELEIEGLGILRNQVGHPQAPAWWPEPRLPE